MRCEQAPSRTGTLSTFGNEHTTGSRRQDRFAELLSEGLTIPQIRERMDLSKGAAQGLMRRIREGLGEQAR